MARTSKQEGEANARSPAAGNRINSAIGKQIRARRNELGLTQKTLAEQVGVSQQQILKYEQGDGRIPADRLMALCRLMQIEPGTLFRPLDAVAVEVSGFAEVRQAEFGIEAFTDRDTVALVRAFQTISDKAVRRKVLSLVQTMAEKPPAPRPRAQPTRR